MCVGVFFATESNMYLHKRHIVVLVLDLFTCKFTQLQRMQLVKTSH